jgi:hypothetical protein
MITNDTIKISTAAVKYDDPGISGVVTASFTIRRDYTNHTPHDLFLKTQSNLPIVIEPMKSLIATRPGSFVEIKTTYIINSTGSFSKTKELLDSMKANNYILSADAAYMSEKMYDNVRKDPRYRAHNTFTMSTYQQVEENELKGSYVLYNRETDVLLALTKEAIMLPHPNSTEGFNHLAVERNQELHGFSGTFVRVIDNEQISPSLFYYSGKRIIEVPAIYDETQKSGVYVTISSKEDHKLSVKTEFMAFDEAEESIGLYRSRDQAYHHGCPEELIKADKIKAETLRAQLEREARERDEEIRRLKHADELYRIAHEREVSQLKQANTVLKESVEIASARRGFEADQRKDNFDRRKHVRDDYFDRREKKRKVKYEKQSTTMKVVGESLKYVPALVLAGLGIYAATRSRD